MMSIHQSDRTTEVLYDYSPNLFDEIDLYKGEIIEIIDQSDGSWWKAKNIRGRIGMIPSNYVEPIVISRAATPIEHLPIGWKRYSDVESGDSYYHNKDLGITQWEVPTGWKEYTDIESGDKYYYNQETDITQWNNPFEESDVDNYENSKLDNENDETLSFFDESSSPISNVHEKNSDIEALKKMRIEADNKMNQLRHSLEVHEEGLNSTQFHTPKLNKQRIFPTKSNDASISPVKQQHMLTELSIEEINKIIEEQIDKELKKKEKTIMNKVRALLKHDGASNNESVDSSSSDTKGKFPLISRSADSKLNHAGQKNNSALERVSSGTSLQTNHANQNVPSHYQQKFSPHNVDDMVTLGSVETNRLPILNVAAKHKVSVRDGIADSSPASKQRPQVPLLPLEFPTWTGNNGAIIDADGNRNNSKLEIGPSLLLDYVHGYDGDLSKGRRGKNVIWLQPDIICYPAAAIVVILNIRKNKQLYYQGHTDDVTHLDVHPDKTHIASGQIGKDGRILIWNLKKLYVAKKSVHGGISQNMIDDKNVVKELWMLNDCKCVHNVNFSGDGCLLVALGQNDQYIMSIFDWIRAETLTTVLLGHTDINQCGFNPYLFVSGSTDPVEEAIHSPNSPRKNPKHSRFGTDGNSCYTIITCGVRHIKFWVLHQVDSDSATNKAYDAKAFKGRKLAGPKIKQQKKFVLEGNLGAFPKKHGNLVPDMTCFSIIGSHTISAPQVSEVFSRVITGTSTGSVCIWQHLEVTNSDNAGFQYWLPRGRLLCVVTDVHEGPIHDIDCFTLSNQSKSNQFGVSSCGKDGIVNIWNLNFENIIGDVSPMQHISAVNVIGKASHLGESRSIQWSADRNSIIIGTSNNCICVANEISELFSNSTISETIDQNDVNINVLIESNFGKIRRISSHPYLDIVATISTDKTLRLWGVKSKKMIALTKISKGGNCIAFNEDGSCVAVGCDDGELLVLTCNYLQEGAQNGGESSAPADINWDLVKRKLIGGAAKPHTNAKATAKAAKKEVKFDIVEVKYSRNGNVVGVSCKDKSVYILTTEDNSYKRLSTCKGHSSVATRMDFSYDGTTLQTNDGFRETLYWEVLTGKQISNSTRLREIEWNTWSNISGTTFNPVSENAVIAAAPPSSTSEAVHAVARLNDKEAIVAAMGGSTFDGKCVKILLYPVSHANILSSKEYTGHHPIDVCVLGNDKYVASAGSNDACIFQWRVVPPP